MNQTKNITDTAETGAVLIDQNNIVLSVTGKVTEIFGWGKEDLLGKKINILLSDAAAHDHENLITTHIREGAPDSIGVDRLVQCQHRDGQTFTASFCIDEIDYAGGQVFLCVIRNIEQEESIRQHSRKLVEEMNAVLNNASYGTLMLDSQLRVRHANATFRQMWNLDQARISADETVLNLRKNPDCEGICPEGGMDALRTEVNSAIEIRCSDGRILERRCVFLPSDNMLLTYYDITNLAQLADSAKSDSDRHTYAMQAADQAFWDWNLYTDKMVIGERFWLQIQRMYLGPEIESKDFFELVDEEDREFLEYTLRAFASGEVEDTVGAVDTFRISTPDGEERFFALGFSVVESDSTPYLTGLIRDITEPRRLRRAITEARDEAREANRAKSDFLATMSHEIRTPMNGILGMAGLLLDTPLDSTQRDYAQIVKESGESLLTIINDILDFSKFEAGRLELEVIEFDLQAVFEGACRLLAPRAHAKNLELETDTTPDLPHVLMGDPGRLRQVSLNLIGNAIKFTDSGTIILRTHVLGQESGIARIRVEVVDTGIGVPEDKIDSLFEKFSQADTSVSRRYGGTGLGLAICRSLISLMNGKIGVTNNKGPGSTFWFELPLEIAPDTPVASAISSDIAGLHICVISSEDRDRKQFQSLFEDWNMAVEVTASVHDALNHIRQATHTGSPFDFALLEVNSGSTDPVEFARAIHDDPDTAGTHLILATSSGIRGEAAQMKEAGFSAYITKPAERPILYRILSELAASKGSHETPWLTKHLAAEHGRRYLNVLVAEDNPVNQKLILALLSKLGHKAELANDGVEAVKKVREGDFDVVLMDVFMPHKNGLEATTEIRSLDDDKAATPIIALTASTTAEDVEQCREVGMNDFLGKPIDPNQLGDCLQAVTGPGGSTMVAVPEPPVAHEIDATVIDQLSAVLGPHQLLELIDAFSKDHDARMERILQTVATGDTEALKREAHDLKGTCGNMGFVGLAELGQEVFAACKANDIGLAVHKLKALPNLDERVRVWLEERRNKLSIVSEQ